MGTGKRLRLPSPDISDYETSPEDFVYSGDKLPLEERLDLVGRPHSLLYFKELRDGILKNTYFREAQALLKGDPFSTRNCSLAIKVAANAFWPRSCLHRPNSEPRGFSLIDASLHQVIASVLVDEKTETDGAVPSVTIADGRGKLALELCSVFGLYTLFDTILDCEVAYLERHPKNVPDLGFKRSSPSRLRSQHKLFLTTRKGWARRHQKQSQAERWITAHKVREIAYKKQRSRSRDGSIGRYRSNLPQSSLRSALFPLEYDLRFMDWSVGLSSALPSESFTRPRPKALTILKGDPGSPGDAIAVKKMLQQTITFLESRNIALAEDVRDLKVRVFKETPKADRDLSADAGPSSSASGNGNAKSSQLAESTDDDKHILEALRDEIHVICSDAPSGINIYVLQEYWGVRKWLVTIHIQNGT